MWPSVFVVVVRFAMSSVAQAECPSGTSRKVLMQKVVEAGTEHKLRDIRIIR